MWLAEAASFLAGQEATAESADVKVLQERQKKLKVKTHCLVLTWHLFNCFTVIQISLILR